MVNLLIYLLFNELPMFEWTKIMLIIGVYDDDDVRKLCNFVNLKAIIGLGEK